MQRTQPPFRADHVGSILRSAAIRDARAKREIGRHAAERHLQLFERRRQVLGKEQLDFLAREQRAAANRHICERDERLDVEPARDLLHLIGRMPRRVHRSDQRSHAGARHDIGRQPALRERPEHADVRKSTRAPAAQRNSESFGTERPHAATCLPSQARWPAWMMR